MFRHDSKFVDPTFYVDPLSEEFIGVECCLRWCQIFGTCRAQEEAKQAAGEAEAAQRLYEQEAVKAQQLIEEQQQVSAQEYQAQDVARAEALTAQKESKRALDITKRQVAAQQQQQSGLVAAEAQMAQAELEAATTVSTETTGTKKPRGAAPKVSVTRVSAKPAIGGYGGTAAGQVNPTGLNL